MDRKKELEKTINRMIDDVKTIISKIEAEDRATDEIVSLYESWYSEGHLLIKQILPSRLSDFETLYFGGKRSNLGPASYSILQYLSREDFDFFHSKTDAINKIYIQKGIINSAKLGIDSILSRIKTILQADMFDNELDAARDLLKYGHIRAAGALAGVLLEGHLKEVTSNHNLKLNTTKKHPTISDYNDALHGTVYDKIQWRSIQALADIRNTCDHPSPDPTKENVEKLIKETGEIIKTVF